MKVKIFISALVLSGALFLGNTFNQGEIDLIEDSFSIPVLENQLATSMDCGTFYVCTYAASVQLKKFLEGIGCEDPDIWVSPGLCADPKEDKPIALNGAQSKEMRGTPESCVCQENG